jgi:hypothetical protein
VVCGSRRIVDVLCVLEAWYIVRELLLVFSIIEIIGILVHEYLFILLKKRYVGIVCFTFGITKPIDVRHLFGPWLRIFRKSKGT